MINNATNLHHTHVGVRAYVLIYDDTCFIIRLCTRKRAAVCIPQPSKQGFSHCRVLQELVLLLVIVDRAVRSGQPNENFTDHFQYSQRVSPKWFHIDLLFNCSRQR